MSGWLEFEDICKNFHGVAALKHISFKAYSGQVLSLVGENGAGKSTLLLHLNGLLPPSSGQVRVGDIPVTPKTVARVRESVGMVFQQAEDQLFMPTVREDVAFGPLNMGLPPEEIRRRVEQALREVHAEALADKMTHHLSGGEKRAVSIATVLSMSPDILVLDEPAAGLDPEGRDTILSQIRNYHEQTGITVILVSHSMEDIARYANRVLVMSKAKVAMYDTVEKVFARAPELLELGLSVPQVTQVFLMLKAMGMEIDTDVYTVPYAVKTVLKAWNAKHPDKAVPLPQNHKTVQEGGAD